MDKASYSGYNKLSDEGSFSGHSKSMIETGAESDDQSVTVTPSVGN